MDDDRWEQLRAQLDAPRPKWPFVLAGAALLVVMAIAGGAALTSSGSEVGPTLPPPSTPTSTTATTTATTAVASRQVWPERVLDHGTDRWEVGSDGDLVALGDWDCT